MKIKLLEFQLWWLRAMGLWATKPRGFTGSIHTFIFIFPQMVNLVSGATNMIQCNGQLDCSLQNATYTVVTLSGIYIFFAYLCNEKLYHEAVATLHNLLDEFGTYTYSASVDKFVRRAAIAFTIYYIIGLLEYGVSPLIDYSSCLKRDNKGSALTCGLPTPGWFPFNSVESPGFEIAFIFQCVCAVLCVKSVVQPHILCCSLTYHVIAQLNMLKDNLKKICDGESEGRCNTLRRCIEHHIALINFSEIIATALNQLMLIYSVLIAVIFSVLGIQIIQMFGTSLDICNLSRYIILFGGWLVISLCLSIVGQKLIDASLEVADCAYSIPWYNESIEFQKMIWLIILRANKPLVLRCASVMSATYSYLTLLYKMLLINEQG